jgi:hypothetical protein
MGVEEREKIMEFYERDQVPVCTLTITPWWLQYDVPQGFLHDVYLSLNNLIVD